MKDISCDFDLEKRVSLREVFSDYKTLENRNLIFCGWVRKIIIDEVHMELYFNDGSFFKLAKIIVTKDQLSNYDEISQITIGSSIVIEAKIIVIEEEKLFVLRPNKIAISQLASREYPLREFPMNHNADTFQELRKLSHLRPRTDVFFSVFRIRSVLMYKIHDFFYHRGFTWATIPIVTNCPSKFLKENFHVSMGLSDNQHEYLCLKDSGQLENECFSTAFSNVYCYGPRFHMEYDQNIGEAPETWMLEAVMQFCNMESNIVFVKQLLEYMLHNALNEFEEDLKLLNKILQGEIQKNFEMVQDIEFEQLTYTQAVECLQKEMKIAFTWGNNFTLEQERFLTEKIFKGPIIVTNYPKQLKAFFIEENEDSKTCRSFNFIFPYVGTVVTGSQREVRLEKLEKNMEENGLDKEQYSWYLDTRRFGSSICTGFCLSFEKFMMYVTGMKDMEDVIPFPRKGSNCLY